MPLRVTLLLIFGCCSVLLTQTVSTEILGLVTDPTGAVIPGATITARRRVTGDVRTTRANETGNYVFPLLDIGEYEVSCSAVGFKTEVRRGIELQLQQKARIDFQMQVGDQVETVEIRGGLPLLRTEDATLGSVIEAKRVVELPLNGRNFSQLATLMPGVTLGTSRIGTSGQGGTPIPSCSSAFTVVPRKSSSTVDWYIECACALSDQMVVTDSRTAKASIGAGRCAENIRNLSQTSNGERVQRSGRTGDRKGWTSHTTRDAMARYG